MCVCAVCQSLASEGEDDEMLDDEEDEGKTTIPDERNRKSRPELHGEQTSVMNKPNLVGIYQGNVL